MDINLIYALLVVLIPVVVSLIFTKRYNILHGLATFLFTSYLLLFLLSLFNNRIPEDIAIYLYGKDGKFGFLTLYNGFYFVIVYAFNEIGLGNYLKNEYVQYVVLGIYAVIFIISHIISVAIRRRRINGIKALRRQVKRY